MYPLYHCFPGPTGPTGLCHLTTLRAENDSSIFSLLSSVRSFQVRLPQCKPFNLQGSTCNHSRSLDWAISTKLAMRAFSCCEMPLLTSSEQELELLFAPTPLNTWWWCIQDAAGSFSWYYTLLILWDQAEFWAEFDRKCLHCWMEGWLSWWGGVRGPYLCLP